MEQGRTRPTVDTPVSNYLRELAGLAEAGQTAHTLVPSAAWRTAEPDVALPVDWQRFAEARASSYLQQWELTEHLPDAMATFPVRQIWPRHRFVWSYLFAGPAGTVTGLHYDRSDNWFCQIEGTKEFVLFPADQSPHLAPGRKFDWGAVGSDLDLTQLDRLSPARRESFTQARGWYARLEPGDALFLPGGTWHAVLSSAPSLSLGIFGLSAADAIWPGLRIVVEGWLHGAHLYRWGNCTCHPASEPTRPG